MSGFKVIQKVNFGKFHRIFCCGENRNDLAFANHLAKEERGKTEKRVGREGRSIEWNILLGRSLFQSIPEVVVQIWIRAMARTKEKEEEKFGLLFYPFRRLPRRQYGQLKYWQWLPFQSALFALAHWSIRHVRKNCEFSDFSIRSTSIFSVSRPDNGYKTLKEYKDIRRKRKNIATRVTCRRPSSAWFSMLVTLFVFVYKANTVKSKVSSRVCNADWENARGGRYMKGNWQKKGGKYQSKKVKKGQWSECKKVQMPAWSMVCAFSPFVENKADQRGLNVWKRVFSILFSDQPHIFT